MLVLVVFVLFLCSCNPKHADPSSHRPIDIPKAIASKLQCLQRGIASWYGTHMNGHLTASGEKYNSKALTAASRKFSLGTKLNVINLQNNRNVLVTVNDRGPYFGERIIDMSVAAAEALDMKEAGLVPVCVQKIE
ncbi:MAG: septal ring lytic transglycosylase RlpA family protein [Candidatus Omnitrophota bacterium]